MTGPPLLLPPALEDGLLRIAQEALTNVGRHATASRVGLTLAFEQFLTDHRRQDLAS